MSASETKVAVITMVRRGEFPPAWSCLRTLEPQLGRNVRHFILLNDQQDPRLEAELQSRDHTQVIAPGRNLGVAAGRNTLLAEAVQWGAEIFVSLDDDLLVPTDYIARMRDWIVERTSTGERIGVVAPVVLDFHAVAEVTMEAAAIADAEQGLIESFWDTEELRDRIRRAWPDDIPTGALYHAGIRQWRTHYLQKYRDRGARLRTLFLNSRGIAERASQVTELRLEGATRKAVLGGETNGLPIDTAAGGACVYTADLLGAIGGVDEAFSPFGYEDSDFAIRALSAGFRNFTLTSELLLHDLDSRKKDRSPAVLLYTQGRARALLAKKHLREGDRARSLTEIACLAPLHAVDLSRAFGDQYPSPVGEGLGATLTYLAGYIEGLMSQPREPDLGLGAPPPRYVTIPDRLDRRTRFVHRSWTGSPSDGLDPLLPVDLKVAYEWDSESATLRVRRLVADSPGQFRVSMSAAIGGVGKRDESGNPDPLSATLISAKIEVVDWGLLRRFQTSAAWFRRERSVGYFTPMLRTRASRSSQALKWFLSLRSEPARLTLSLEPPTPITAREAFELTPGVNQDRRLGLRAMVKSTTRY